MLTYMRKNASSWIIKILFGIIVVVFIFFYGFSDVGKNQGETVVATVGERTISMAEYQKAYKNMLEMYRSMYQNRLDDDMLEKLGLRQQVLEDLINREVLLQAAERYRIEITPEQVRDAIRQTPVFQENGRFSERRYQQVLSFYGITAVDFERDKEKEIMIQTFQNMVTSAVKVSDQELREMFQFQNEEAQIEFLTFSPARETAAVDVGDEELTQYFEQHRDAFRVPETVNVRYVVFDREAFEKRVEVSEDEIRQYYQEDQDRFFEPKKVRARHILFKLDKDAAPETVTAAEQKASQALERITRGEDFAALATAQSEDEATAGKGGDLGFFTRGTMVKPFADAAFGLQPGETSGLVRTPFGFHIIRAEEVRPARVQPLDEVARQIRKDILAEKTRETVRREARRAYSRLFKSRDLEGYADENGFDIMETGFFAYGQSALDRPDQDVFSKEAFGLQTGDLAPSFKIGEAFYLIKLVERREAHVPELQDIRTDVEHALIREKKTQQARQRAETALAALSAKTKTVQQVAEPAGCEIKTATFPRQGDYIKGLGKARALKDAAFTVAAGAFGPEVYEMTEGYCLFQVQKRGVGEAADFEAQKDTLRRNLLQQKQREIFDQFLQKLKTETELKVNRDLIAS